MKKLIYLLMILLAGCQGAAIAQKKKLDLKLFLQKYPLAKTSLCKNCLLWENPYYKSIADTTLKQPVIVYHEITKAHLLLSDQLKSNKETTIDRAGFPFKPLPGFPNEKPVFDNVNDSIKDIKRNPAFKKGDEVAEGHVASADDYSYDSVAMAVSMLHPWNLAIQWQSENVGTKLGSEYMGRDTARAYGIVYNWGGVTGTQGIKTDARHKVKVNYPAIYWELFNWTNAKDKLITHCYWFPNNAAGAGQSNYPKFEIPLSSTDQKQPGLIQRLGFDPTQVIKPN